MQLLVGAEDIEAGDTMLGRNSSKTSWWYGDGRGGSAQCGGADELAVWI